MTAKQVYQYFLMGIKRESTSVVTPNTFNEIIWRAQIMWLAQKAPANDIEQKIMDDLQPLRVITDGTLEWDGGILDFVKPTAQNIFDLPVSGEKYPKYYRMQSMQIYIIPSQLNTGLTPNEVGPKRVRVLKADKKSVMSDNYYRKATADRIYYEVVSNKIRIIGKDIITTKAILEYLRYPKPIFFDSSNADGGIGSELGEVQTMEIVNLGVALYLEENRDPRINTFQKSVNQ